MTVCAPLLAASLCLASALPSDVAAQASTVIFVRHAEKGATPTAADPDLSDAGKARSGDLAAALANFHLDAVYVTEYRRTRQTADSVAAAQHVVPIVVAPKGGAKAYAAAVVAELKELPAGNTALVIGHSNTFATVIALLGGPRVPDFCDAEYGSMYLLELSGMAGATRLLKVAYGPPDSPDGQACSHKMRIQ